MKALGKALLIGNGVNLAAGLKPSWSEIVKHLFKPPYTALERRMKVTPFPLLIEEAFSPVSGGSAEGSVQSQLVRLLHSWQPAPIHHELLALDAKHILTTNYDLALEGCYPGRPIPEHPYQNETRYSLFRRNVLPDGKRLWHIHGSIQKPNTMVLGYEHYAGYLHVMRHSVVDVRRYKRGTYGPVKKMMSEIERREPRSWLEIALTHHLMILGLSLDFAELGLWWLLTYRARMMRDHPGVFPLTQVVFASSSREHVEPDRREALICQLKACRVKILHLDLPWPEFYQAAFQHFQQLPT